MASVLKVDTLTGVTTAGSIAVTGEGNSTTTNLQGGLTKMYSRTTGAYTAFSSDSLNADSLVDNGTGDVTINFTNNFSTSGYSPNGNPDATGAVTCSFTGETTSSVEHHMHDNNGNDNDNNVATQICGDLA